jgi:hypothetical protein
VVHGTSKKAHYSRQTWRVNDVLRNDGALFKALRLLALDKDIALVTFFPMMGRHPRNSAPSRTREHSTQGAHPELASVLGFLEVLDAGVHRSGWYLRCSGAIRTVVPTSGQRRVYLSQ